MELVSPDMEACAPDALLCREPLVKQELEDNPGCEMWMFSQTAVRQWETSGPLIKMEYEEETTGFAEGDIQAKKVDFQAESEKDLETYNSSLRPAEACDPQGDHPLTVSCAEVEVVLEDMSEGSGKLACGICGRRFMSRDSLRRHTQLHEGDASAKRHQCRLSPYATQLATEPHEKPHAGGRPHVCRECGRAFTVASQLKAHLRVHAVKKWNHVGCDDGVKTTAMLPTPEIPAHTELAEDGTQWSSSGKWRNLMPALDKKMQVIKRFNHIETVSRLAAEHACSQKTVHHLHSRRDKILSHMSASSSLKEPLERQSTKTAVMQQLDSALCSWISHRRAAGEPVSSHALVEKAQQLHRDLGIIEPLSVRCGWLYRFMHQHGMRALNSPPERLPIEDYSTSTFCRRFLRLVDTHALSPDQLYGATELELHWKGVPEAGRAMAALDMIDDEDRISVLCCANAAGTHRLPLAFIGRASKSSVLNGLNEGLLPAVYFQQKPAYSYGDICMTWFHHNFIPAVKDHLSAQGLAHKAVLVLADTPSHPEAHPLHAETNGCQIFTVYMSPSTAMKLQPMQQGVVQSLHRHYTCGLIGRQSEGTLTSKEHAAMDVLLGAVAAWTQVETATLVGSWRELWPSVEKLETFNPVQPENGHEATNMALLQWQTGKTPGCRGRHEENMQTGCTWGYNQSSHKLPKDKNRAGGNDGQEYCGGGCFQNINIGIVQDGHCLATVPGERDEHVTEQSKGEDVDVGNEVDDDPPSQNGVSARRALMALETVLQFLEQQPDTDHQEMAQLLSTRRKIKSKLSVSSRQEALMHLFHGQGHLQSGKSPRLGPHCLTPTTL